MSIFYPDDNWWNEATEYSGNFNHFVICQHCMNTENPYDGSVIICDFCGEDIENAFFEHSINVPFIVENHFKFEKLEDNEFDYIIRDLYVLKYECPECSSIDDEQYYCTSCEGEKISEAHRLLKELNEKTTNTKLIQRISNVMENL